MHRFSCHFVGDHMALTVGVDVGGTFTDVILYDDIDGKFSTIKVPTTPEDPSLGFQEGLKRLPISVSEIDLLIHGTTVTTNAVLQRRGARCGLITTAGFRDVLELRRRDRPTLYGLKGYFQPLIERDLRFEIEERTDFRGNVETQPSDEEVREVAQELIGRGVEVVIVSFINSYANSANEQMVGQIVKELWPNPYVVLSSEVLPEIREFERTSTAVLSGYVQPILDRYLQGLVGQLREEGFRNEVLLVQSNGGVMSQELARQFSVNTILSGPAAGVIAAQKLGSNLGIQNLITCDIGGTSLDLSIIEEGHSDTAREISLEYGLPMRTTMLDISSHGAGGGSVVWIDRAGIMQIGPQSAGAVPGPVCYRQGGMEPTVTDANLVLGRIGKENPIGRPEGWEFDVRGAEVAIQEKIGSPLGLTVHEAAWIMLQVTNNKVAGSIRARTVERGHDPRDFALVAYGGAGPLHADALRKELELSKAIIPPLPGIASALGCILADVRHDFIQTLDRRLDELDVMDMYEVVAGHEEEGRKMLEREVLEGDSENATILNVEVRCQADMVYDGQVHEVLTPIPVSICSVTELRRRFEESYRRQYGDNLNSGPVRIRTLRTTVIGLRPKMEMPGGNTEGLSLLMAVKEKRPVYFDNGFQDTPVYARDRLPAGTRLIGPAVMEQSDATTIIEPGGRAEICDGGSIVIENAP